MDIAASIIVKNKNNVWVNDNMVTQCYHCRKEFGILRRKHHCRNCGNIFCYKCSEKSIVIPSFITDRPEAADYWNISYYINALKGSEEKVCNDCYNYINSKIEIYEKIMNMFESPISLEDIKQLSESNAEIKNHYFHHLRNIQYYLPNHRYSDIDKKLLKVNAKFFCGHSKYIVHLIKSINWENNYMCTGTVFINNNDNNNNNDNTNENLQLVMTILHTPKIKECSYLFCTRTCNPNLSCDDCVNILFSYSATLPNDLLKYLFDIIARTPEQIILCHLSFFITLIKNNYSNKLLHCLIFNILNKTLKLQYHTYWFLINEMDKSNVNENNNMSYFINLFDKQLVEKMYNEYIFFAGLINKLDEVHEYMSTVFSRYKPISLPYDPTIKLVSVNIDKITIKNSYTKPVIIPFEAFDGNKTFTINLLFKKESIMNDVTVLNLITLCDIILNETDKLRGKITVVTYPTMPLTSNSGMIEIIDNAETVYAINKKKKSITQHIFEKNQNSIVGEVLQRYLYSLVSYTLHSYFIGLGDRHLQNIMITDDAEIFHIDFGFILGKDAYPLTGTEIKLNSDILDVISDYDGLYPTYLELCSYGLVILRKYFNMFFILLLQTSKYDEKHVEKFIMSRFQPRQTDAAVVAELKSIIKNSHNAYSGSIKDFIHHHTQEKTIQTSMETVMKTAFNTIMNLTGSITGSMKKEKEKENNL